MYSPKLSALLVLVPIFFCCVPSYSAQFSSQIVEQFFMTGPNESQYRFPLFPSRIPFGLSSFSTSTAVLISFSQNQCLATATATGACHRLAAVSVNTSNKPNSITTTKTPILLEPTQVLRKDIVPSQTAVPLPFVQDFTLDVHSVVVSSRVEPSTFMLD